MMLKYLPYVLLIAAVTAVLYAWGLYRSSRQERDLLDVLYGKGERLVLRELKKGARSKKELTQALGGIKASLFYSKNRVQVQDPKAFADNLLSAMCDKKLIVAGRKGGSDYYRLP